ncbi:MAG TPA: stage III sporulation protein AF [Thermoanaerobacterales bacterium]|jgi:stage III sporulation protein AF|nr:stage III sporulation protein AF [Thermoanaerobacterales bacterium]
MLKGISNWIKQIVIVVILVTFIDALMPNKRFLRYAKVLSGLVVMISIISPLLGLFNQNFNINEQILESKIRLDNEEFLQKAEFFKEKNEELAIKEYKRNIDIYISEIIKQLVPYEIKKIDTKLQKDKTNNNIKFDRLDVVFSQAAKENNENIKIEKVSIELNDEEIITDNSKNNREILDENLLCVKQSISKQFDIPIDNISFRWEE